MNYKQSTKLSQEEISIISNIKKTIRGKKLPDMYPGFMVKNLDAYTYSLRNTFKKNMGFLLISKDWIKDLSHWIGKRRCIELMAGLGALSCALKVEGVDIIATDDYSWSKLEDGGRSEIWNNSKRWTYVEKLDAVNAVEKYGESLDIIIITWPHYEDKIAVKALNKMRKVNPSCIMIYIGEEKGGCTANDEFFDMLERIEDESFNQANRKFQTWTLTKDQAFLIR